MLGILECSSKTREKDKKFGNFLQKSLYKQSYKVGCGCIYSQQNGNSVKNSTIFQDSTRFFVH